MMFSLNIFHAGFAGVTTIINNVVLCIVLLALVKYRELFGNFRVTGIIRNTYEGKKKL
jgi:hypothetical protein